MSIKRTNILSLIGGNSRYHSCFLTTYSFDFHFFEMKMIKWLRSRGVTNTVVFIDGYFYSELMQNPTGEVMYHSQSYSPNYSLIPIFEEGIFHPKILMLFGEKEGLLIVGSGNLTNSGNGSNDEVWGAFHFDINKTNNRELFSSAWSYFNNLSQNAKGISYERVTSWITDNSKWIEKLPSVNSFQFSEISKNESVAFLYNSTDSSIWQNVLNLTGNKKKVTDIIVVSPYYDKDGKSLIEIKKAFSSAKINVVLDESGVLPYNLNNNEEDFSFFDWKELNISRDVGVQQKSRLHAKILYLKSSNGIEYCLFGSSNITAAGLGNAKIPNNEVSLFVKSTKGNLLDRLCIKIRSNVQKSLSSFDKPEKLDIPNLIISKNSYTIKLYLAETYASELTVYSNIENKMPVYILFYDKNNQPYRKEKIKEFSKQHTIRVSINDEILQYIQIQNLEGKNISNKILVSSLEVIAKAHPNPKNAEFQKVLTRFQNGELTNILDLIYYASTDESEKQDGINISVGTRKVSDQQYRYSADQSKLYDLSEYRPVNSNAFLRENSILQSPTLQVLDAIKFSESMNKEFETELRIDEQMNDTGLMDGDESFTAIQKELVPLKALQADKRKIYNYFSKLHNYLHYEVLYSNYELSVQKLTLTDLSKYLVALELIHIYGGKIQFIENEQLYFDYLPLSGNYEVDNVKGFCLNIIGDFLRLARNGFVTYDYEHTNKKVKQLQSDALTNSIICILNISWNNEEKHYFKTLLLNCLHFLGWNNVADFDQNIKGLFPKLKKRANSLTYKSRDFNNQLEYFINCVCPAFRAANNNRENKIFSNYAKKGQIIYFSTHGIGYSCVLSVLNENKYALMRAGFEWDEETNEFSNPLGDDFTGRIEITKMTVVDL